MSKKIDTQKTYDSLKDFQLDTVAFAYEKLQKNGRYLVADEVGLGKTMVAKGIIAKTYDALKNTKDTIEIIYITTNQSIASQNIETLKIGNSITKTKRLSLLVTTFNDEENNGISFRSFTVGTSLEFKESSTGLKEEREFLIFLLKEMELVKRLRNSTLDTFFKQTANEVDTYRDFTIPDGFINIFEELVNKEFPNLKEQISANDSSSKIIKELRKLLVIANLKYLSPDLIILDEFQRFSKLLVDEEYEDKKIIEILFNNEDNQSKTLLLSATPYKLLDCKNNEHYDEFYNLIEWLLPSENKEKIEELKKLFLDVQNNSKEIENILKDVMCRTERVSFINDSMVKIKSIKNLNLKNTMKHYLNDYDRYTKLNISSLTRYLKSAPSALNYMKEHNYIAKRDFLKLKDSIKSTIKENKHHPKFKMLEQEVKNQKLKDYIWMPPLNPYVKANKIDKSLATKMLIFSQWDFVPDSIIGCFSVKTKQTKYTDKKSFINRDKLLKVSNYDKNPYEYKEIMTFTQLIKKTRQDNNIASEIDTKILLGSPANVIYRSIKKYGNIADLEILKFYIEPKVKDDTTMEQEDWQSFSHLFLHHLGKSENYQIMDIKDNERNKVKEILDYCIKNNIQSMMDEYIHLLTDSPRYKNIQIDKDKILYLLDIFKTVFTMRPNEVSYDKYGSDESVTVNKSIRFAMRISKSSMSAGDNEKPLTADNIKISFNSPFAPFILATTSIGQEGLDFHPYCHQIWHWDLPSNPVDLEQREGRIHRYKNYAVRKNIAQKFHNKCWVTKFEQAKEEKKGCDFTTFWLYTDSEAKMEQQLIERVIPLIPLSRESSKYIQLEKQLSRYRNAIGQKSQKEKIDNEYTSSFISLKPSRFKESNYK